MNRCDPAGIPEHPECFGGGTSQHWPKRSHAGKASVIVARLCWGLHDAIDNGFRYQGRRWANSVTDGVYTITDRETGDVLYERAL